MGKIFAYEDHNGFKKMMFITDHKLSDIETYCSHYDVWNEYKALPLVGNQLVDYDYFPRGRVVYRKTDDLFIIYYDKCVEDKLSSLTSYYVGCNYETKLDEHYCCHKCNSYYLR